MVVLLTVIESSPGAIFKHQLGGLELLRLRTPYRHRTGLDQSLFIDLRMFWVTTAIANRKATFLASKDWLTVPWSEPGPEKDILHHLLDIAVDIPAFLEKYDTFKSALSKKDAVYTELVAAQNAIKASAITLDQRLQLWFAAHASHYEHGRATEVSATEYVQDDELPRFYLQKRSNGEIYQPPLFVYPNLLLATCICLYRALRLVVAGCDSDGLFTVVNPTDRYQLAVDICRSLHYYLFTVPGYLVSRLMFVMRVSFDTFAEGMIEKQFIRQMFHYIGEKYRFRVFANQCSEASSAVRPRAINEAVSEIGAPVD